MKIKIETLTPIHIGGDQADNLSPYSDFVWQDGKIIYIDNKKLESYLTPEMVSEWVDGIRDGIENTRSAFSLADFLARNKISIDQVTKREITLPVNPQRKAVRRFIHSSGRPYIPGSSLKGAIRTAFVYQLLEQTGAGKKFVQNLVLKLQKRMGFKDHKNLIKEEFQKKIHKLLDRMPHTDPFKNLLLSDSQFIPLEDIQIASIWRFHLKRLSADSPSWREVWRQGASAEFTIKFKNDLSLEDGFWQMLYEWDKICSVLNEFAKASIKFELESMQNSYFSQISNFYQQLDSQMNNLKKDEAIMRIGAGKTFFDNTIDLAFSDKRDEFFRFRKLFDIGKKPGQKNTNLSRTFPISRFFIGSKKSAKQPLGWVKISRGN